MIKVKQESNKLSVAPDGAVPNTAIEKEVDSWLKSHGHTEVTPLNFFKSKKKSSKQKDTDEEKEKRSKQYREQLKEKMRKMIADEQTEEQVVIEEEEVVEEKDEGPLKLRVGHINTAINVDLAPLEKQIVEMVIPQTIERFMHYEWFPEDLIFHRAGYEDMDAYKKIICTNSKGVITRIPVVDF